MNYLVDTNVISETRRAAPAARVVRWIRHADPLLIHLSVLTLGEIAKGAAILARRDPVAGKSLSAWLTGLRDQFAARIVSIDAAIAVEWGRMSALRPLPVIDGLLAATAAIHGMTLVTRNVRDFADLGVTVVNPWDA